MFQYFAPEWISAPNSVTLFTVIVVLATAVLMAAIKRLNFILRVNQIPGVFCGFTIFGNAPLSPMSPEGMYHSVQFVQSTAFCNLFFKCRNIHFCHGLRACYAIMWPCSSCVGWTFSKFHAVYT